MSTQIVSAPGTCLALKEWGAVAHALLDGRQTVLLRKGGIHERAFRVDGTQGGFVVFPTVAHSHAERVRAEHTDLLTRGAADVEEDGVIVRCGLRIVAVVVVQRPDALPSIEDLHIWTAASVQADRLEFRPRHPLQVLVVEAFALDEPVRVLRTPEHAGCRSWVDLPLRWDANTGTPVHDPERLRADAERVRHAVA